MLNLFQKKECDCKNGDDEPANEQLEDKMEAITNEYTNMHGKEDNLVEKLKEHKNTDNISREENGI